MTTYYVDASAPDRSDSNTGMSVSAPFADLAGLKNLQPGDTVAIRAGTSYTGGLTISASGTAAAPITFTSYGAGSAPVISTTGQNAITLQGASYVIIDRISVEGAVRAGVMMDETSAHNTLRNMEVTGVAYGYDLQGSHDNTIVSNYIHDLHMFRNTPGGNDDCGAEGIALESGSNNNEISHNKIVNAIAPSYDYGMDGGGFEFWGSVSNVKIHDNVVLNSDGFVEVGGLAGDSLSDIQIYNNVSAGNSLFSWLHNDPSTTFGVNVSRFNVINNTIYEPAAWYIAGFDGPVTPGSFAFSNNIVYAPASGEVFSQSGTYHTGNFYQSAVTPTGSDETSGTIAFANPALADLHITSGAAVAHGAYTNGHEPGLLVSPPTGQDVLDLAVSEDAYKGDARFTVQIDGVKLGGTFAAHALHTSGASGHFLLTGNWGSSPHTVKLTFINDAWGGTSSTDRNLYIDSIAMNGTIYSRTAAPLNGNGSKDFEIGGTIQASAPAPDKLTLRLSEDAYRGDAQFRVTLDGKPLDTAETVLASHAAASSQDFIFTGSFGATTHDVGVSFLNDAYGGSASTDRNLYVNSLTFDSHTYAGSMLADTGTVHFKVAA